MSQAQFSIYDFERLEDYLLSLKNHFPGVRRPLTLNRFSQKLGYKSPRAIAMMLKGQRAPSRGIVEKIARVLKLTPVESRYLELLARLSQKRLAPTERERIESELTRMRSKAWRSTSQPEEMKRFFSAWYTPVLKQIFESSQEALMEQDLLHKLKKNKVSIEELALALETLKALGLITQKDDGWVSVKKSSFVSPFDVPSQRGRSHHLEMMGRAAQAMEEDSLMDREFLSITFRHSDVRTFKKIVRETILGLVAAYHDEASNQVVQLNTQFFKQTSRDEKGRK